jgi:ketosteroid isomerase-like protein
MPEGVIGTLSTADHASIRALTDRFVQLMLAGNLDGLVTLYTENAVLMPPHHPEVQGRAALRAFLGSFPRLSRFSATAQEIDGRADLAYVRGSYSMTLHPEGAPGPVEDRGKFLEVRRRQPDGSWLLAVDIFNSDEA